VGRRRGRVQCRFDLGSGILSAVSLTQIRTFVTVAETGNLGRAARALRIAQPALSRQIRSLEDELGAALFVRTPRGMTLSTSGEAFLPHARTILASVEAAARSVGRRPATSSG
jgi:DNA-binding transcriptional LysR family regulator